MGLRLFCWLKASNFPNIAALFSSIHKRFVRTGKLSKEQGKNLNWLFELRSIGDYGGVVHVSEEQAEQAVCFAENFLEAVKRLIQEVQFQLSIPSNP